MPTTMEKYKEITNMQEKNMEEEIEEIIVPPSPRDNIMPSNPGTSLIHVS